jgi:alkanesulfonate monooxygenase SsuD/methylene tetrahydromethanopterin reductase-like flavin-dependent oxidoreductase (luciferase family)
MRIGLIYALGAEAFAAGGSYAEALTQVEEADRLALDHVLFEEHHGARGCPAPASLAAAAATRTRSIRVGSYCRQLTLEYPVNGAEDFALLDILARGRALVGVTPGLRESDFQAAGVPWSERETRFREALELLRTVWTQANVQFIGAHYRFPLGAEGGPGWRREPFVPPFVDQWRRGQLRPRHLPVLPKPVQLPHPPIWVTAWSRATIEWAAAQGFGLLVSTLETETEVRAKVRCYCDALARAGRDANQVDVALAREVFLAEDEQQARALALPSLARHVAALRAERVPEQADLAIMNGAAESTLLDTCFLVGTARGCVDRLKPLQAELGINHLLCRVYLPGRNHFDVLNCIRLLASQLHPRMLA